MEQAFQTLLVALVVAVVTLLTYAVQKLTTIGKIYLEQKLGVVTFGFLKDYAMTTVRFLQQQPAFQELTGAEKKQRAINELVAWCQSKKIPVDYALIDKVIEEAVNVMNEYQLDGEVLSTEVGA